MKRDLIRIVSVLAVALVLVLALVAWVGATSEVGEDAGVPGEPRLITVTGDAQVRVVPDEVILTLGVETWNKDLAVAKGQNDTIVSRVLDLAGEYGVAPQHVQTDYVSIVPRYRNGYYEDRDFVGYFVHKTIAITLRDLSQFEGLLAATLESGVNYVHGVEFRTTELREHRDEARALAINAAREKAEALAQELGQTVGEPHQIREEQSNWRSGYNSWWGAGWGNSMSQNVIQETRVGDLLSGGSLAPGQIDVNARVTVTFELTK